MSLVSLQILGYHTRVVRYSQNHSPLLQSCKLFRFIRPNTHKNNCYEELKNTDVFRVKLNRYITFRNSYTEVLPLIKGRKLNVRKMFRRSSRRLLNVLCTFNLRSVPRGFTDIVRILSNI